MAYIKINTSGLRFGKLPQKKDYRTFLFQNYLKDDIPTPLPKFEALDRVYKNLNKSDPTYLFPMDDNDQIGDCTVVGMAHGDTVWGGLVTKESIYPVDLIRRIYFHLTGGSDTGLNMLDVLEYFRNNFVANEKIYAYVSVNPHNKTHIKQAINLFGGLFVGFQVQEKCLEEFGNRIPWQPGTLINAGHAIFVTGYDQSLVNTLSWGNTQKGTWAWWDECVEEAYAILPPEATNPNFAPGFDFAKLRKDLTHVSSWSLIGATV